MVLECATYAIDVGTGICTFFAHLQKRAQERTTCSLLRKYAKLSACWSPASDKRPTGPKQRRQAARSRMTELPTTVGKYFLGPLPHKQRTSDLQNCIEEILNRRRQIVACFSRKAEQLQLLCIM
jgi:hypothetical protein